MLSESLRIVVALFGAWTIYAQVLIFLRYDFSTLVSYSPLPLLLGASILFFVGRKRRGSPLPEQASALPEEGQVRRIPGWFWFLAPFAIVGLRVWSQSDWLFWVLSSALLLLASIAFRSGAGPLEPGERAVARWEWLVLAGICATAVMVTMGTLRPDPDDAFFVSLASSALDYPTAPLYGFDNLYRSGLPLLEQARHLMQTYEYFVATVSSATGISVHALYYVTLPVFWTVVGVLIQWFLLRRFLPPASALIGLAALVVMMALWGDEHRTYGNFGFVRMYQGKAIFLLVALPMIVSSVLTYCRNPNWRNWIFLALHLCAGAGFSLTALFVGPLAAGMALLAGMRWSRRSLGITAMGLMASLGVLAATAGMKLYLNLYLAFTKLAPKALMGAAPSGPVNAVNTANMANTPVSAATEVVHPAVNNFYDIPNTLVMGYQTVLGLERDNLVLLGLLLLPFLASRAKLRGLPWICRYLLVGTLVVLCPAVAQWLGLFVTDVLSWRIFWSWPVPVLLALALGAVASMVQLRPLLRASFIGSALLLFAFAGPLAVSNDNWALENVGRYKVYPSHAAAEYLMTRIDLTRPAYVPEELAMSLGGLRNAPPLVALRNYYLRSLRGFVPTPDLFARRALLSYIDGRMIKRIKIDWVMAQIEARDVATVAYRNSHRHADKLSKALRSRGFELEDRFGYVLAVKELSASPVE